MNTNTCTSTNVPKEPNPVTPAEAESCVSPKKRIRMKDHPCAKNLSRWVAEWVKIKIV